MDELRGNKPPALLPLILLSAMALGGCTSSRSSTPTDGVAPTASLSLSAEVATPTVTPSPTLAAPTYAEPSVASTVTVAAPSATTTPTTVPATPTIPPPTGPPATATTMPAAILSFTSFPAEILPGEVVTLTWEASGEWTTIYSLDMDGRMSEPWYEVPPSGTLTVQTKEYLRNSAGFVLFAGTGTESVAATTSVGITCPDDWFFPDPPSDCPLAPDHTNIVAQHFQRGLMLWLEASGERRVYDEVLILYQDEGFSPRWQMTLDRWSEGMLESKPDIIPPEGYYQPIRGFGLVWREEPGVRDRLGWATDEEFVVGEGYYQCAYGKYGRCYVTGPENQVYVLEPERSGWSVLGS